MRAAEGTAPLIGNASAGVAQKAIEVTAGVAAGSTAVLVAGAEITTLAGKLSRRQTKNFKFRMNKMKVM